MTQFIDFVPSTGSPFQFQAQFDGDIYTVIMTWSLFGARYIVNIYDLTGTLIVSRPLVGSPSGVLLSSITNDSQTAIATTSVPHVLPVGSLLNLTVSDVTPADYVGTFASRVLNETQFSYQLATNPSDAISLGNVAYNISLTAGYFSTQLVWRPANNQFEII
jgi:hypothetical protein